MLTNSISSRNTSSCRAVTRGASEHGEVTNVPSRNENLGCFDERKAIFTATKSIY
jgi:hypothetical protein